MPVVFYVLLALLLILIVFTAVVFYQTFCSRAFRYVFARKAPVPKVDRSPVKIDQKTVFGRGKNWFYTTRTEYLNVRIDSFDGTKLSGYFRPSADRSSRFAVILLHDLVHRGLVKALVRGGFFCFSDLIRHVA